MQGLRLCLLVVSGLWFIGAGSAVPTAGTYSGALKRKKPGTLTYKPDPTSEPKRNPSIRLPRWHFHSLPACKSSPEARFSGDLLSLISV